MSKRIVVLTQATERFRFDNLLLIPSALRTEGWDVVLGDVDTLSIRDGGVWCKQVPFTGADVGDPHPVMAEYRPCDDADLVWALAIAHPGILHDGYQLMWVLNQRVPFVNSPTALYFVNNKIALHGLGLSDNLPATCVSNDITMLDEVFAERSDQRWVIKPPNSGCGADVFVLERDHPNRSALLQSATGNAYQKYEMFTRELYGAAERYAVLQHYIETMRAEEKRVLIAGGIVVGGNKKTSAGTEFRGNLTLGGTAEALTLSTEEEKLCVELGRTLQTHGVHYVGIDLAYPYLVEVNLVNPGGLNDTLETTGIDASPNAVRHATSTALAQWPNRRPSP